MTAVADDAHRVVAKVNGAPIALQEVEREIDRIIPRTAFHRSMAPEKRDKFRKEATERVIDTELRFQEAKVQGIKAEKKEIKERVEEIKKKFPSDKEFKEALKRNNMSTKDLESKVEKAVLMDKVYKKEVEDRIKVSEDEIKKHYEDNVQKYREMEQVRLRRIIIKYSDKEQGTSDKEQGASDKEQGTSDKGQGTSDKGQGASDKGQVTRGKEEARVKAEELLARIKKGEDFAAVAYDNSEDPYRVKGGDMGYIHRGRLIPELENIAFGMNNGEVTGPLEVEEGFNIIKLEDKKPEKQLSFDEAKDRIKKELENRKREERIKEWFSAMRAKAKIEYIGSRGEGVGGRE